VMAFLEGKLKLIGIPEIAATALDEHQPATVVSAVTLERADAWARRRAADLVG
jgi:1-deoxy-D-xylulose 5-phosphate reductoisomerase